MQLNEFISARIGTRFWAVTASGRLTEDARRGGASKAISQKGFDRLKVAFERGEDPDDKLTNADLRLLRIIEAASLSQVTLCSDGTFWHPQAKTIDKRRLERWEKLGIIEPLQAALFPDIASSYTVTPKGLRIGKGAPRA